MWGLDNPELYWRLLLAAVLGGLVGFEQVRVPADFNAGRLMEELLRLPGLLEVSWEGADTGTCSLPR